MMRPFSPRSAPTTVASLAASLLLVALPTMIGCSAMSERLPYQVDCSPYDDVEVQEPPLFGFQELGAGSWYNFVDRSPRGVAEFGTVELAEQDEAARCGDPRAFQLRSHGFNDWGAGFGNYSLTTAPADGSGWEGIALWARTSTRSDRSITLVFIDRYGAEDGRVVDPETGALTPTCRPPRQAEDLCARPEGLADDDPWDCCDDGVDNDGDGLVDCVDPDCCGPETRCSDGVDDDGDGLVDCADPDCCGEATGCGCDGSCASSLGCEPDMTVCRRDAEGAIRCVSVPKVVDSAETSTTQTLEGQVVLGGAEVPDRYDCGHEFSYALTTTPYWQLHLIPFGSLIQPRNPNLSPAGFDASAIHGFVIRTPREAQIDLWLDDITFYRRVTD